MRVTGKEAPGRDSSLSIFPFGLVEWMYGPTGPKDTYS